VAKYDDREACAALAIKVRPASTAIADRVTLAESSHPAVSAEMALLTGGGLGMIFQALCAIIFEKAKTGYKRSFRFVLINDTAKWFRTFLRAVIDVLEGFYIMVCVAKKGVFSM
jgi:hypothetical protein